MDSGTIDWALTIIVFGALGSWIASRGSRRAAPLTYVALLVGALVGYYVGVDTRLVHAAGLEVFLNWSIVACCVGGCLGLLLRNSKLRRLEHA